MTRAEQRERIHASVLDGLYAGELDLLLAMEAGRASFDPLRARPPAPYEHRLQQWAFALGWRLENFLHLGSGL
jgi:hypothetical protein